MFAVSLIHDTGIVESILASSLIIFILLVAIVWALIKRIKGN